MRKIALIALMFVLLSGCSRFFTDDRDPSEAAEALAYAASFVDDRPMDIKAQAYEDLLFARHFILDEVDGVPAPWFTTDRRLKDDSDPHGYSAGYKKGSLADAAWIGGRIGSALAWQHSARQSGGTPVLANRIDQWMYWAEAMCTITGEPGLVVRGVVSTAEVEREGYNYVPDDVLDEWDELYLAANQLGTAEWRSGDLESPDWHRGDGRYGVYWYKSDASPGQFGGIASGLQMMFLYGPERHKAKCAELMGMIARYLIKNNWQIIDIDGEPTQVSDFEPNGFPIIVIPSPAGGSVGVYYTDGGITTLNRPARNLELLKIMRAAAIMTQDPEIIDAYNSLLDSGMAASRQTQHLICSAFVRLERTSLARICMHIFFGMAGMVR